MDYPKISKARIPYCFMKESGCGMGHRCTGESCILKEPCGFYQHLHVLAEHMIMLR